MLRVSVSLLSLTSLASLTALALVPGLLAGCGRIGLDAREAPPDAEAVVPDAAPVCPDGTTELAPGDAVCIELVERGTLPWNEAVAACGAVGRRLCGSQEWLLACESAVGLVDMANDEDGAAPMWEWLKDNDGVMAEKRGLTACTDESAHTLDASYDFRCCVGKS